MTGYLMTEAEAARDLDRLDAVADPTGRWDAVLAGIALRFGAGRLEELGAAARDLGGRRALVVTDPGLRAAGHVDPALASLRRAGCDIVLFDRVEENPSSGMVATAAAAVAGQGADIVVGLGGGSALDAAKAINILLTNGGTMRDYWGYGKTREPLLPSIGVPTTAGTGSEAQSYALVFDPEIRRKMACGAADARFGLVILDPRLLVTAPRSTVALAGMDALSHALESFVTRDRTRSSCALARRAWTMLEPSYPKILDGDREALAAMALGAHLAGAAIEQSMLGAAHAMANPLTAELGVPHAAAVGLALPHVVRWNASSVGALYDQLTGGSDGGMGLSLWLEEVRRRAGLPERLREVGAEPDHLPRLAAAATREWTGEHNPRRLSEADFLALYEAAL